MVFTLPNYSLPPFHWPSLVYLKINFSVKHVFFKFSFLTPGTLSEIDLCQSNQSNPAFELALNLDASPISFQNESESSQQAVKNSLCAIFISSLYPKICLLQTEAIVPYSKTKPSNSQFKYKCENIFTKSNLLNSKLIQSLDGELKKCSNIPREIIHSILYSI